MNMAGPQPLALQLEQLLNPRPREADPEADPEEGEVTWGRATCGPGPRVRAASLFPCGGKRPPRGLPRAPEVAWAAVDLDSVLGRAERPADRGSVTGTRAVAGSRSLVAGWELLSGCSCRHGVRNREKEVASVW